MPFRYSLTGAALPAHIITQTSRAASWGCRRFFHPTLCVRGLETNISGHDNHYETLNVPLNASPADIKKSFYVLSKRHHPDHNPSDPHASTRFMRINEAYSILSHADKRARYDRDHLRLNPHYHHHPGNRPGGSYHSSSSNNPAGGRPASGLSRRRGTYQGPPPSFYRSGGWGVHGAKRRAAHEQSTGGAESRYAGSASSSSSESSSGETSAGGGNAGGQGHTPPPPGGGSSGTGGLGGMGPGQRPFKDDVDYDTPHFNRKAHERAQRRSDDRRAHKQAREKGVDIDHEETNTTMSFFGVVAILGVVVLGPIGLFTVLIE
ncbi:uncharacterized protein C8A04DRAFT_33548 [Dichotomopilus funicola]|uniref:J domain-containing protein n=1 Tax=Dichotomopilus funicola TaxID=1934379 RepID=A0AAN6ZRY0_9PEZI|nr:hypothetical protein C8A04DRAFT_33548 [Dichotomopilus funicola]